MSLLSKKIALSVAPAGSLLSSANMQELIAGSLASALTEWTGRSSWTLTCDDIELQAAKDVFSDETQTETCLINTADKVCLVNLEIDNSLEKLATAQALGMAPDDISEELSRFSKIHSRIVVETLVENMTSFDPSQGIVKEWISAEATKLHVLQAPDTWIYKSVWTVYDATEDSTYGLKILCDRRMFPDSIGEAQDAKSQPDLESLQEKLGPCRLPVRIVGGNLTLSIAHCMKLEIGQVLGLPEIDFNAVEIKMADSEDVLVHATLGTHFGAKAVKLSSAINDDFLVRYATDLEMV